MRLLYSAREVYVQRQQCGTIREVRRQEYMLFWSNLNSCCKSKKLPNGFYGGL